MSKGTPTPARPALDASGLADRLTNRCVCIYRDGRHYVPLFVPGGGSEVDELTPALAALRALADMRGQIERARGETLAWLLVIASARKASMGAIDNTYCPQINALRVDEAIATLKAALARCAPSQEGKSNV